MRLRSVLTAFLTSALIVGSAWAGIGLAPVERAGDDRAPGRERVTLPAQAAAAAVGDGVELGADEAFVGAAKVSIEPRPDASKGEVWRKEGCQILGNDAVRGLDHVADFRTPWPEDPNCIYMGGYGIGPMNPIKSWDQTYGLWSRSVAISRGGKTVVLTILDAVYYFGAYRTMCVGCGAFDLSQQLADELNAADPNLGLAAGSFVFASTHSHTAPDFIGGWGGIPDWYHRQVAEAMKQSVREAVASMQPAVIVGGDAVAREFNAERRDNYRSAEDQTLAWFRAIDREGSTIATVGAYAAHAVSVSASAGMAHADYPGAFDKRVEDRFGGVGLLFQAGLGNMSPRDGGHPDGSANWERQGRGLAERVPATDGTLVKSPNVRYAQEFWDQPVTNSGLAALGLPGFFDRPFSQTPSAVRAGKNANKPCTSASPVSVRTAVSAMKVGNMVVTAAPGEIFSNYSNTIKEQSPVAALSIGAANDGLGYIIQSFETDHAGRQVTGFVAGEPPAPLRNLVEYEDAYSIDHCFADVALETTLRLLRGL